MPDDNVSKTDHIQSLRHGAQTIIDQINAFGHKYLTRKPQKMVRPPEPVERTKLFIQDILDHIPENVCSYFVLYKENALPRLLELQTNAEVAIVTIAFRGRIIYDVPQLESLTFFSSETPRFLPKNEIKVKFGEENIKIAANQIGTIYHNQVETSMRNQYDELLRITIISIERANILSRSERNYSVKALRDLEPIEKKFSKWRDEIKRKFEANGPRGQTTSANYVLDVQKFYAGIDWESLWKKTFEEIENVRMSTLFFL